MTSETAPERLTRTWKITDLDGTTRVIRSNHGYLDTRGIFQIVDVQPSGRYHFVAAINLAHVICLEDVTEVPTP